MRTMLLRGAVLTCLALVAGEAVWLWCATGRAVFTRYHDPEREKAESAGGLAELFEGTGLEEETGPLETVPNRFTLGLLPSGGDRHIISVATLSAPLLLAVVLLTIEWVLHRRSRRRTSADSAGGRQAASGET